MVPGNYRVISEESMFLVNEELLKTAEKTSRRRLQNRISQRNRRENLKNGGANKEKTDTPERKNSNKSNSNTKQHTSKNSSDAGSEDHDMFQPSNILTTTTTNNNPMTTSPQQCQDPFTNTDPTYDPFPDHSMDLETTNNPTHDSTVQVDAAGHLMSTNTAAWNLHSMPTAMTGQDNTCTLPDVQAYLHAMQSYHQTQSPPDLPHNSSADPGLGIHHHQQQQLEQHHFMSTYGFGGAHDPMLNKGSGMPGMPSPPESTRASIMPSSDVAGAMAFGTDEGNTLDPSLIQTGSLPADPTLPHLNTSSSSKRSSLHNHSPTHLPQSSTPSPHSSTSSLSGYTGLHLAARTSSLSILQLLLQHNFDINTPDERGQSCLHICASLGNVGMVQFLLENGAERDVVDGRGETALHLGVKGGWVDVVAYLLGVGNGGGMGGGMEGERSWLERKNGSGRTAFHCAVLGGNEEIVRLLLDCGCDAGAKIG